MLAVQSALTLCLPETCGNSLVEFGSTDEDGSDGRNEWCRWTHYTSNDAQEMDDLAVSGIWPFSRTMSDRFLGCSFGILVSTPSCLSPMKQVLENEYLILYHNIGTRNFTS
mmetsp:Transcript_15697/g.25104  ORF Transcript_15697/g.25104 Transcript_15697/m.25104 type:complete len:111 (+) Transcript_15697:623-955(+)